MRFAPPLVEAEFVRRENRFAALVRLDGHAERVHVPNSGRMRELLLSGATVLLQERHGPTRRTSHDLVAVETPEVTVSVDSRVPNAVFSEALAAGVIPGAEAYRVARREYPWGASRLDLLLSGPRGDALVEVKGCTLVTEGGLALFPDAPTTRGARHMAELERAVGEGLEAMVAVVVQRSDGRVFAPNDRTDPAFGDALRSAHVAGVRVMAIGTRVDRKGIAVTGEVPVVLRANREVMG